MNIPVGIIIIVYNHMAGGTLGPVKIHYRKLKLKPV